MLSEGATGSCSRTTRTAKASHSSALLTSRVTCHDSRILPTTRRAEFSCWPPSAPLLEAMSALGCKQNYGQRPANGPARRLARSARARSSELRKVRRLRPPCTRRARLLSCLRASAARRARRSGVLPPRATAIPEPFQRDQLKDFLEHSLSFLPLGLEYPQWLTPNLPGARESVMPPE
jgi:hypothetical protein